MMAHSGPIAPYSLSNEAVAALQCGDIQSLLDSSKRRWGGLVMMADPPDDDEDKDKDDPDKDDSEDSGGDSGSDKDKDDPDEDKVSREEFERIKARMKAADKRADDAEAKVKKAEDAKKDDLTKAQDDLQEAQSKIDALEEQVSGLRLQNAFLTTNKHVWHNPDVALNIAQSQKYLDGVVDEQSGEVDKVALGKAMDRLAKENAYLVKTEDKKDDDEPDGPSGEPAGGRSKNNKDAKKEKEALKRRFPVLNR
jgi:hypothetical protein